MTTTKETKDGNVNGIAGGGKKVKPEHLRHCDACDVTVSSHGWKGHLRSKAHQLKSGMGMVTPDGVKQRKLAIGEEFIGTFIEGVITGYERGRRERRAA